MAERKILVDFDFKQNEIQNAVIQVLASNPETANLKNGQIWYNSTEGYIYFCQELNGTKKLLPVGYLPIATADILGGIKVGSNLNVDANTGVASIYDGDYTHKGVVELATEEEVTAGTSEALVVNVLQLKKAIDKALTSAVNYKGMCKESQLPTSGQKLGDFWSISDFDVTHEGEHRNGRAIWNGNSWDKEVDEYLTPDNTTIDLNNSGELRIKPITQTPTTSAQTATYGGKVTVIDSVTVNGYGQVTGVNTKTVTMMSLGKTSTTAAQGDLAEYIANKTTSIRAATSADDTKYPTEKAVRTELDKKQDKPSTATAGNIATFNSTKETIDSGKTFTTTIAATGSTSDNKIPTESAVRAAINGTQFAVDNGALTPTSGVCTWNITNSIGTADVVCSIREKTSGNEVMCDITYGASIITVKINSSAAIAANTYRAVVVG